ncbi:MAG: hypothetical protein ACI9SG_000019 [Maribacter sp.]|jgi:hypothetical protein
MKNSTRFSYSFVFAIIIVCIYGCNTIINGDLTNVKPTKLFTVEQLILESKSQLNKETEKDIVLEVNGIVHEVNYLNDRYTIFLKGKITDETYVICDMNTNQINTTKAIKSGDSIVIKGLFKGVLKDVIMLNCVVVNTK